MPEFQDRCLVCADCGGDFTWTAGEQLFYAEKGLTFSPKRCKACKEQKNMQLTTPTWSHAKHDASERVEAQVQCADCGTLTTVPFQPTQGRPVYCRLCFNRHHPSPKAKATTRGK